MDYNYVMENLLKLNEHPNNEGYFEAHFYSEKLTKYHSHEDFYEIFITLKPSVKHVCNKEEKILKEKTACFIKPKKAHKLTYLGDEEGFHHFNVAFSVGYFERIVSAVSPLALSVINESEGVVSLSLKDEEFEFLIMLAKDLISAETFSKRQTLAKLLLINLAILTETRYQKKANGKLEGYVVDLKSRIDSLEYIDKNANELYKKYPVSFSGLIKKFKQVTGKTVIGYLSERRVEYAKRLLLSTEYSVLEISSIVGYESLSHFIKVFKLKVGTSPLKYRKQNENAN